MWKKEQKLIQSILGGMMGMLMLTLVSCERYAHFMDREQRHHDQNVTPTLWLGMGQSNMDRMIRFGGGDAFQNALGHGNVVIDCAISGSYIEELKPSGTTFNSCLTIANAYMVKYPTASIAGIIYYQGESDAMGPGSADDPNTIVHTSDYAQVLLSNFQGYRSRIGNFNLPIVFAQIATTTKAYPFWDLIKAQQASIHYPNTKMIVTEDLPIGDSVHLVIPGSTTQCGQRFADAIKVF